MAAIEQVAPSPNKNPQQAISQEPACIPLEALVSSPTTFEPNQQRQNKELESRRQSELRIAQDLKVFVVL
jgi:hypothetical protein